MFVRATKFLNKEVWYKDLIGEVFEVEDESCDNDYYLTSKEIDRVFKENELVFSHIEREGLAGLVIPISFAEIVSNTLYKNTNNIPSILALPTYYYKSALSGKREPCNVFCKIGDQYLIKPFATYDTLYVCEVFENEKHDVSFNINCDQEEFINNYLKGEKL